MRIALDFDGTITEDEWLWSQFAKLAMQRGHSVTIVTARHSMDDNSDIETFMAFSGIPCYVTTYGRQKATCFEADVWIDDMPDAIPEKW